MAKAAKAQPAPEPLSLADQIRAAQQAAEDFIMKKSLELKAGEGRRMPILAIRHMLTRGISCECRAALHLFEKDEKEKKR